MVRRGRSTAVVKGGENFLKGPEGQIRGPGHQALLHLAQLRNSKPLNPYLIFVFNCFSAKPLQARRGRPQHATRENENYISQHPARRRPTSGARGQHGGVRGARFTG